MKNLFGGLAILVSLFILASCGGNAEKEIIGTWKIDLASVEITLGDGFPADMKKQVSGAEMMMKSQSAEADKVSIEFKEGGKFVVAMKGEKKTQDGKWSIDGDKLTLTMDVDGKSGSITLNIDDISSDEMTISLTAEDILAQVKKEMPELMKEIPSSMDVNKMVKGTSVKATFKK